MLNKVQIIGYLGKDPEVRYLPSGNAVANVSIATTEKWKDKQTGEQKEHTEWHRCTFYNRLAEIVGEYLVKGSLVYVSGKIKTTKYTDKTTGVEKYATDIQCDELKMLGGRGQSDGGEGRPAAPRQAAAAPRQPASGGVPQSGFDDMDDDIPF